MRSAIAAPSVKTQSSPSPNANISGKFECYSFRVDQDFLESIPMLAGLTARLIPLVSKAISRTGDERIHQRDSSINRARMWLLSRRTTGFEWISQQVPIGCRMVCGCSGQVLRYVLRNSLIRSASFVRSLDFACVNDGLQRCFLAVVRLAICIGLRF